MKKTTMIAIMMMSLQATKKAKKILMMKSKKTNYKN